jgi:hypothetical protein
MIFSTVKILAPLFTPLSVEDFCKRQDALLPPFSEPAYDFIDALSSKLLRTSKFKAFPEMIALGFWLRKANIKSLVNARPVNSNTSSSAVVLPRGLVFHIAPSNVDTIFIYSLVISLLMGNKNIVRLSSKSSEQQQLLLEVFNEVLHEKSPSPIFSNLLIITYPHDDQISKKFSMLSDARMIWGGDSTVSLFSGYPIKPTSIDIKFANKYSVALLDLAAVDRLDDDGLLQLAKLFVNDTYLFGQQACSSPRTVFWLGTDGRLDAVKTRFWHVVQKILTTFEHGLTSADFVEKLVFCSLNSLNDIFTVKPSNNMVLTLLDADLNSSIPSNSHCGRGTFVNVYISDLVELNSIVNRSVQTLTYFGVDKGVLENWLCKGVPGFDRIVPVGKGLDFDFIWDGVDLFTSLSRIVTVK